MYDAQSKLLLLTGVCHDCRVFLKFVSTRGAGRGRAVSIA